MKNGRHATNQKLPSCRSMSAQLTANHAAEIDNQIQIITGRPPSRLL